MLGGESVECPFWAKAGHSHVPECSPRSGDCYRNLGLCTPVLNQNHGDRVLGEEEKSSFIALPGKGGHNRLMPSRLCPP